MQRKAIKPITIIRTYFGDRPGVEPGKRLQAFSEELKALSPEEKEWLATEAAKQLDVDVDRS